MHEFTGVREEGGAHTATISTGDGLRCAGNEILHSIRQLTMTRYDKLLSLHLKTNGDRTAMPKRSKKIISVLLTKEREGGKEGSCIHNGDTAGGTEWTARIAGQDANSIG